MTTPHPLAVVHYAEISLKGGNRPLFLRQLRQNIERATADLRVRPVRRLSGRLVLDLEGHADPVTVRDRIARVCGVATVSLGFGVEPAMEAMKEAVGALVKGRAFGSFRITARRAFKTYPKTSVELNRELGAFVLTRVPARVDLGNPELTIYVEVLPDEAFVYAGRTAGPGDSRWGPAGWWRRSSRGASTRRWPPGA